VAGRRSNIKVAWNSGTSKVKSTNEPVSMWISPLWSKCVVFSPYNLAFAHYGYPNCHVQIFFRLFLKLDFRRIWQRNGVDFRWLNQQLTEAQLGKMAGSGTSSRYNGFTPRPSTNALSYSSCLTSSRPVEATTPLSYNSGNSSAMAFKNQFPMSSSYLSSTTIPVTGTQNKPQQLNGLGAFHSSPSLIGSQHSIYAAKCASQSSQCVRYKPKVGLTTTSTIASTTPGLYTAGTMSMDSPSLNSWDDSGSWGSKQSMLPRPQLSFADRY
jgi:hypothetical protein